MKGLKIQRIKNNLTQSRLAEEIGISLRQIRSYEQGQRHPKIETIAKIAKYFNCTIDELL